MTSNIIKSNIFLEYEAAFRLQRPSVNYFLQWILFVLQILYIVHNVQCTYINIWIYHVCFSTTRSIHWGAPLRSDARQGSGEIGANRWRHVLRQQCARAWHDKTLARSVNLLSSSKIIRRIFCHLSSCPYFKSHYWWIKIMITND